MIPFADALSSHVRALRDEKQAPREARPGKGEWWSLSGTLGCHRKRVIERAHETNPDKWTLGDFRTESLVVFEYGDRVEAFAREALDRWLASQGLQRKWQFKVSLPLLNARGTGDLLVHWPDGTVSGHDVKSASGKSFKWSTTKGSDSNKGQLTAYLYALQTEMPALAIRDTASLFYLDKEYGNMVEVEFNWREWIGRVEGDYKDLNAEWKTFEGDGPLMNGQFSLPPEVPFQEIKSSNNKHVEAGRARKGDMAPSGLCSPLYCRAIHHCPIIAGWWKEKTETDVSLGGYRTETLS